MIKFPSGNNYKLVYIDTNVINEISKNTRAFGKNFLQKYANGEYMFVTSVFNLIEMSKTKGESRDRIIEIFDIIPLGINHTFPQIIEFEKYSKNFNNEMIIFATGPNGLFNNQISDILDKINNDEGLTKDLIVNSNLTKELEYWKEQKELYNWISNYKKSLIISMNETFRLYDNYFEIKELGEYYSLEVLAYIKNQFIYAKNEEIRINSIIDAYNVSFLPYVEEYITEKTVASWLETAKSKMDYLKDKKIVKLSSLYD